MEWLPERFAYPTSWQALLYTLLRTNVGSVCRDVISFNTPLPHWSCTPCCCKSMDDELSKETPLPLRQVWPEVVVTSVFVSIIIFYSNTSSPPGSTDADSPRVRLARGNWLTWTHLDSRSHSIDTTMRLYAWQSVHTLWHNSKYETQSLT